MNSTLGNLPVLASYYQYDGGRLDTVKIKMTGGTLTPFKGKDSIVLVIQKFCDVVLTDLLGDYTNTNEYTAAAPTTVSYGPYTTSIANLVSTSATSATGTFQNLYDDGWNDVNFTIDWSNKANMKITIPLQATGKGYGGAASSSVRTSTTKVSKFNTCTRTFDLYIDLVNDATGVATTTQYNIRMN